MVGFIKDMLERLFANCLAMLIFYICISLILGYIVSILWNMLMPIMFGFVCISYWQGILLMILCCLLFSRININYKK